MGKELVIDSYIVLNLGCGNKLADNAINVDFADNSFGVKPDVAADLRKLPFEDDYADEIHAIHVIEHFYTWEVIDVLREWHRVLKPGGKMALEMPDLNKVLDMLAHGGYGPQKTYLALYGDQIPEDPNMVHKWCYTFKSIKAVLEVAGFKDVEKKDAVYHVPIRDMRVECVK